MDISNVIGVSCIIAGILTNPITIYDEQIQNIDTKNSYEYTIQVDSINQSFLDTFLSEVDINKVSCLGDSITYGNGGSDDGMGNKISYCNYLSDILDCEVINLGIGGTAIGDYWDENSFILRWNAIPDDSDIIIIFGGVNDYFIGNYGDASKADKTFTGDCYKLFENINNKYINSDIYVVLNFKNESEYWDDFVDHDLSKYMELEKQYADEFNFKVINLYESEFLNSNDLDIHNEFIPDGIHPNDAGNKILAREIATQILLNKKSE